MNILNAIAMHVTDVYDGENWTDVNIANTLSDVTWRQAQQQTAASKNTIASLLHHLYYWNGVMMERIKGNNPSVPNSNGFNVDVLKDENDWSELKEKTRVSFVQLADAVKNFPAEKLFETSPTGRSSYYKNFQGMVEHAHYHLGQMVIIKKLL
ncbi:MAG TPA: DinB family protein [Parafilimonas sp.]|nr:DinB family protein [Parafilimonas sp.]